MSPALGRSRPSVPLDGSHPQIEHARASRARNGMKAIKTSMALARMGNPPLPEKMHRDATLAVRSSERRWRGDFRRRFGWERGRIGLRNQVLLGRDGPPEGPRAVGPRGPPPGG